jgi:hypothetical protein
LIWGWFNAFLIYRKERGERKGNANAETEIHFLTAKKQRAQRLTAKKYRMMNTEY